MVEKNPMKYFALVKPCALSCFDPRANRTELRVKRTTQLRLQKVIFCFTMITARMRVKASWEERSKEEVETGRYEFPHEKSKLLMPNRNPMITDSDKSFGVNREKGRLSVHLKR